ncbi:MAG: putative oxidoreductase YciK [Alphaproteobacteria bacterium MarineAlpha2_Bin1]|nr:MAG: putative oxidoreductase YciK [Alphaproteobacteria bacterium MarineAlpha2_Bin1]
MNKKILNNKIVLITGASRGIGAAVAKRFAREGAHLILVSRNQGGLEKIDDEIRTSGIKPTLVPIDITDEKNMDLMASEISKRFGKIDVLVGNAAILGPLSPMSHYDPKMWKNIFDVNVHANWRLIRNFEMLLRQSKFGRAIFVTSGIARKIRAYWGPYSASKAALEKMVLDWSEEIKKTNLKVNIIDPGRVRTDMRKAAYPGENPQINPHPDEVTDLFVQLSDNNLRDNGKIFYQNQK